MDPVAVKVCQDWSERRVSEEAQKEMVKMVEQDLDVEVQYKPIFDKHSGRVRHCILLIGRRPIIQSLA